MQGRIVLLPHIVLKVSVASFIACYIDCVEKKLEREGAFQRHPTDIAIYGLNWLRGRFIENILIQTCKGFMHTELNFTLHPFFLVLLSNSSNHTTSLDLCRKSTSAFARRSGTAVVFIRMPNKNKCT